MSEPLDESEMRTVGAAPEGIHARAVGAGEFAGQLIGNYKLLEKLGEGGMGTVWMAQQSEPVLRRVALKIIKLGMDTREVVARFEVERQALALMDHPHIAKVLDAGSTESGRPYFVMELVRGTPITSYCDQAHLELRERLELFIKVCNALQHAHHKGIIHRDVKPSNVLVALQDGLPQPKVIDFGIAKATSSELTQQTLHTKFAQVIGTLEYMAPEQAESGGLDIDTRADVYSLGALLYELLTGTKPFDIEQAARTGFEEVLRAIREDDPAKPSTRISMLGESTSSLAGKRRVATQALDRRLRGDLDWIVMKALEKDRTRRYESANGFAEDIANYLADEPVDAAPPSALYRLSKLLRRRRKTALSLAIITLLLVAGSVGTGIGWWKTTQANRSLDAALGQKASALAQEEEQRLLAEVNASRARNAELQALAEAERATLAEAATKARADELEQVAAFQAEQLSELDVQLMGVRLRAALLDAAPQEQRKVLDQNLAGVNFTNVSLETLRDNIFKRTIEAIDRQFALQPLIQAQLLQTTANTWSALGLLGVALDPQVRALSIRRASLGAEHPETLSSITNLGSLLESQGKLSQAEPLFLEALAGQRRVLGDGHIDTLSSINNLGLLLQAQGKLSEAEALHREALAGKRRALGVEHPNTLNSINNLGLLLQAQGQLTEAETLYREALAVCRRVLDPEHPSKLMTINNLASVLESQGKLAEAEALVRETLAAKRRVLGDGHPDTLTSINNLGTLFMSQGKFSEAEPLLREALAACRRVLGDEHPNTLNSITNLGVLLMYQAKFIEAEPLFWEALAASRRVLGDEHRDTRSSINNLGSLLEALLRSSRETGSELQLGEALGSMGAFLLDRQDYETAEGLLAEALDHLFVEVPEGDARPWQAQFNLGRAIAGQGRFAEAESILQESAQWLLEHGAALALVESGMAPKTAGDVLQALVHFEATWHAAQPGKGHDSKAASWQAELGAWAADQDRGGVK